MNAFEIDKVIGRLFTHFRMKHPGRDTIEMWLDDIGFIPDEAAEWIVRKICNEAENIPRNIVKAFKDLWQVYKSENPDKVFKADAVFCAACGGRGLLWFTAQEEGMPYRSTVVCRCGHCDNHQRLSVPDTLPRLRIQDGTANGWECDWRNNKRSKESDFRQTGNQKSAASLLA
jgi:DNA-directed RNA polymerase subunit M/transcription elongation factor TFIIS